jgi:hypothetical protein
MSVGSKDWIWVDNKCACLLGPNIKLKLPVVRFVQSKILRVFLINA